jgi:hypothetical protein
MRDKIMLKQRAQTTNPKLEQHKVLLLHICKLPVSQSILPLNKCRNATRSKILLTLPGAVKPPALGGSTAYLTLDHQGTVRPPQETGPAPNFSKTARTNLNTFQMLQGAQIMHKLLPSVDNA